MSSVFQTHNFHLSRSFGEILKGNPWNPVHALTITQTFEIQFSGGSSTWHDATMWHAKTVPCFPYNFSAKLRDKLWNRKGLGFRLRILYAYVLICHCWFVYVPVLDRNQTNNYYTILYLIIQSSKSLDLTNMHIGVYQTYINGGACMHCIDTSSPLSVNESSHKGSSKLWTYCDRVMSDRYQLVQLPHQCLKLVKTQRWSTTSRLGWTGLMKPASLEQQKYRYSWC